MHRIASGRQGLKKMSIYTFIRSSEFGGRLEVRKLGSPDKLPWGPPGIVGFLVLHRDSEVSGLGQHCVVLGLSHSGTMPDGDKAPFTEISEETQPFLRGCCVPVIRLNAVSYVVTPASQTKLSPQKCCSFTQSMPSARNGYTPLPRHHSTPLAFRSSLHLHCHRGLFWPHF